MRPKFLLLLLPACVALAAPDPEWRSLWNGQDLSGWTTWLQQPERSSEVPGRERRADGTYVEPLGLNRDPLRVFTVVETDGRPAIRISGEAFGELRSRESLQDYHLRLQFKWGQKKWPPREKAGTPRDSGLLYHVHTAPGAGGRTWARSVELQIQEHDVGDLYAVGSQIAVRSTPRKPEPGVFDYDPKGEWRVFSQIDGTVGRCVKQPDNEKPNGEWNTVELVCLGEEVVHIVNGRVVMRLHGARRIDTAVPMPVVAGQILLQSEGAELFYRDIEVRPISRIPAEYAE